MYDDDYDRNDPRRLSYITSPLGESITTIPRTTAGAESLSPSSPLQNSFTDGQNTQANGQHRPPLVGKWSYEKEPDAGHPDGTRPPSETATSSFPLNDIDYESNPAAVAQELNNLAAIRRMSMDVAAAGDPDLPGFSPPPSPSADEDDASRLFWVPARLHPELAPKEFKSFLDTKADHIKRRSGDYSAERKGSTGGLHRKKSMLSRQIDTSAGYTDGADRLERQRSQSSKRDGVLGPNLQQLETLVDDSNPVEKDTLLRGMQNASIRDEDKPILPPAPLGNSLRRSTRTQYIKAGTVKKGEKLPYSKRVGRGASESAGSDTSSKTLSQHEDQAISGSTRVSTDQAPTTATRPARTSSASSRSGAYSPALSASSTFESIADQPEAEQEELSTAGGHGDAALDRPDSRESDNSRQWQSRISSNGRSTVNTAPAQQNIPAIVETPPAPESNRIPSPPSQSPAATSTSQKPSHSHESSSKRSKNARQSQEPASSLGDLSNNPQMVPGNSTRTDSLSFIPTLPEERKTEERKSETKKSKDKKDSEGGRKSSWHWLLGSEEKDKKKDKDHDSKKSKSKATDKSHDNTRLDVLQSSIESTPRARESLVLDRLDPKLDEERRKDNVRRTSGDSKKEKDGIFSSIFGGGRKKHSSEGHHRKHSSRNLSPDPPMRVLRADLDYPWTRFSILEERAIYRMAHIKLANPKRALYSQVLLSNFMYSYLAKVQQMHPQMSAASSGSSHRSSSKSRDQPDEYTQYQRYQEVSKFPHSSVASILITNTQSQEQHYAERGYDDSSAYDYDDDPHDRYGAQSRGSKQGYENGNAYGPGHYQYGHSSFGDDVQLDDDDDDDMW
ncbi:unnamed protein product [Penicillium salamii]|uniref:Protein Zds1 C-terminal domain-containing protein n=1 Tax=Penicillium salamii TaxID=1612424 RepID=A0A9W4IBD4_9EURO|nr:unnamed protein product [Penicillium salamii]